MRLGPAATSRIGQNPRVDRRILGVLVLVFAATFGVGACGGGGVCDPAGPLGGGGVAPPPPPRTTRFFRGGTRRDHPAAGCLSGTRARAEMIFFLVFVVVF